MSAVVVTDVISLLDGFGFDTTQVARAGHGVELVIDTFDAWRNSALTNESPVAGCGVCFRVPDTDPVVALARH